MHDLEYPHTFTSQLKGQTAVEHDHVEFEIGVEATDAEVSWYRDGKKINPEQVHRLSIFAYEKTNYFIYNNIFLFLFKRKKSGVLTYS